MEHEWQYTPQASGGQALLSNRPFGLERDGDSEISSLDGDRDLVVPALDSFTNVSLYGGQNFREGYVLPGEFGMRATTGFGEEAYGPVPTQNVDLVPAPLEPVYGGFSALEGRELQRIGSLNDSQAWVQQWADIQPDDNIYNFGGDGEGLVNSGVRGFRQGRVGAVRSGERSGDYWVLERAQELGRVTKDFFSNWRNTILVTAGVSLAVVSAGKIGDGWHSANNENGEGTVNTGAAGWWTLGTVCVVGIIAGAAHSDYDRNRSQREIRRLERDRDRDIGIRANLQSGPSHG
jgi:hypothetical protein